MNRAERRAAARNDQRYVLACAICGREFTRGDENLTLGEVERGHFMRLHDTAKITFQLLDRQRDRRVVRSLN